MGAALEAGAPVESLFVGAEGVGTASVDAVVDRAVAAGVRVYDLGPGVMERLADTVTPQPLCAVVAMVDTEPGSCVRGLARTGERLVLVCADVRDPGNLGAVIRSGAAAGASAVICCEGTADPFNPKAVRATAGALFSLPIARGIEVAEAITLLASEGFRVVATTAHEGTDYAVANLSGDVALFFGNEAAGLRAEVVARADEKVTIPMADGTESLNVAMTATVLSHEIARRHRLG